jgi:hypothetical protein
MVATLPILTYGTAVITFNGGFMYLPRSILAFAFASACHVCVNQLPALDVVVYMVP